MPPTTQENIQGDLRNARLNSPQAQQKRRSAIIYQSLYLANLLLVPGLSFLALLYFFVKQRASKGWQRLHLYRATQLSVLSGVMLVLLPVLVVLVSGEMQVSIMVMLVYFVTIHALFVLVGMLNIARAMANRAPLF